MEHDRNWFMTASVDEICAYTDRVQAEMRRWLPVMEKLVEVNNLLKEVEKDDLKGG
jgi:hypothetical protein